ncbi:unnamed protein product [Caenorhabditis angaria]|uniref:RING-type domain-containing protein n=1 Tax=Caenorhabditis angaria TaxID=860376 RepID=A0A9P1IK12_9PELO|nr:unnamed protein product [Caenorhabditis angaria]
MEAATDNLKDKLKCGKCGISYGSNRAMWFMVACNHHTCHACYLKGDRGIRDFCMICRKPSNYVEIPLVKEIIDTLDKQRLKITQLQKNERKTRDEADGIGFRAKRSRLAEQFKCRSCLNPDFEQNLNICQTCHGLKFENKTDVEKSALCSNCAIRNHMRKGHQTVDFLPFLRAYKFEEHSLAVKKSFEEFTKVCEERKLEEQKFREENGRLKEQYDQLTEMARKSRSTSHLISNLEKLKNFIDEAKIINTSATNELKARTLMLQNNFAEIKKFSETMTGNCVKDEEIVKLEE